MPKSPRLLEIFLQIFLHSLNPPLDRLAYVLFRYALSLCNFGLALAEYVVGLDPPALRFGQGIERLAQAASHLSVLHYVMR